MITRTYRELIRFDTFESRFEYLKLSGSVGRETFGFDRFINQDFYRSAQWRNIRTHVIARDLGNDLALEGFPIHDKILIHHMNPMLPDDIAYGDEDILNPEFLITTTLTTHNAIHYGDINSIPRGPAERRPGDTKLW